MKGLKKLTKQIALALVMALMVSVTTTAAKVQAAKTEEITTSFTVEVGENSYLEYEETDSERIAVYYVDGVATQKSVYNLETGVILYYDLSQNAGKNQSRTFDMRSQNVIEYHIDDFKKTDEKVVAEVNEGDFNKTEYNVAMQSRAGASYSFLKSKTFTFDGEKYKRSLYGYTGKREYMEDYWYFEAKVTITVVAAAVGFFYPQISGIVKKISNAAGALITALEVEDWVKECYWRYKFVQSTPTSITFECPYRFPYKKYKRLKTSEGNAASWETFYTQTYAEREAERDDILESPGLYY